MSARFGTGACLLLIAVLAAVAAQQIGSPPQLAQLPTLYNGNVIAPSTPPSLAPSSPPGGSASGPFKVISRVEADFNMEPFSRDGLDGEYCGHPASNITLLLNVGSDALPGLTATGPWDDATNHTITKDLQFPIYRPADTGLQAALLLQSTGFDQMNFNMSLRFTFTDGTTSARMCFPEQSCGIEGKECVNCVCNFHPNYCILPYIYPYGLPPAANQGDDCAPLPIIAPPPLSLLTPQGASVAPAPAPVPAPGPPAATQYLNIYMAIKNITVIKARGSVPDHVFVNKFSATNGTVVYTDTISGGTLEGSVNLTGQNGAGFVEKVTRGDQVTLGFQLISSVTLDIVVNATVSGANLITAAPSNTTSYPDPALWPAFSVNASGIAGAILPNTCDGWLAADKIGPFRAETLKSNLTTLTYKGTKAPSVCGAVSQYLVVVEYGICQMQGDIDDYSVCLNVSDASA